LIQQTGAASAAPEVLSDRRVDDIVPEALKVAREGLHAMLATDAQHNIPPIINER